MMSDESEFDITTYVDTLNQVADLARTSEAAALARKLAAQLVQAFARQNEVAFKVIGVEVNELTSRIDAINQNVQDLQDDDGDIAVHVTVSSAFELLTIQV